MIFVTVGTQLPFPRMLKAIDLIAGRHGLHVIAQTCEPGLSLDHIEAHAALEPSRFDAMMQSASLIVGHAGIGTILGAGRAAKPLIIYPRRASMGEHRNEHQLATASALREREGIRVALDDAELEAMLLTPSAVPMRLGESPTRAQLLSRLRDFALS